FFFFKPFMVFTQNHQPPTPICSHYLSKKHNQWSMTLATKSRRRNPCRLSPCIAATFGCLLHMLVRELHFGDTTIYKLLQLVRPFLATFQALTFSCFNDSLSSSNFQTSSYFHYRSYLDLIVFPPPLLQL